MSVKVVDVKKIVGKIIKFDKKTIKIVKIEKRHKNKQKTAKKIATL